MEVGASEHTGNHASTGQKRVLSPEGLAAKGKELSARGGWSQSRNVHPWPIKFLAHCRDLATHASVSWLANSSGLFDVLSRLSFSEVPCYLIIVWLELKADDVGTYARSLIAVSLEV